MSLMVPENASPDSPQRWTAFTFLAGVLLPSVSIIVETTTQMCAETFFDPIPTLWHVLLVVFVPLANLQVWLAVRKGETERGTLLGAANALAVAVSLLYTVVYLPLLPLAVFALIFLGLGVLPMAPVLSLVAGLILRRQLRRMAPAGFAVRPGAVVAAVGAAVVTLALLEVPATLTRMGMRMAASDSPAVRDEGVRWLRAYGSRDYMLRACYEQTGRAVDIASDLFSLGDAVTTEEARRIYFRVTGETFNTRVPLGRLKGHWQPEETFDFDPDQGGEVIAGKVRGLSLAASRIDGSLDADAGVAYTEWTMVFRNESARLQEARAEVQLPPGGVVSRLTLWVNGEEREAAFAGRNQVREAYQQVVSTRRDPVLVTTSGRDRVKVQCYPVPASGGEMKIRFGVTSPLELEGQGRGVLRLPHLLDRNFALGEGVEHAVWVESKAPLREEARGMFEENPKAGLYAVRGGLKDAELAGAEGSIRAERSAGVFEGWAPDAVRGDGSVVRQLIAEEELPAASSVVLVLDTSERVGRWAGEVASALRKLPPGVEVKLLRAGGNGLYEEVGGQLSSGPAGEVAAELEKVVFAGGADSVPALGRALDLATEAGHGAVVWVHGPQPLLLTPVEELRRRWERRSGRATVYSVQTEVGPDLVGEGLDGVAGFEPVARMGGLRSDLESLLARVTGQRKALRFVRVSERPKQSAKLPEGGTDAEGAKKTSAHVARLWANDEVGRMLADRSRNRNDEAVALAARYQLVTPVTGAVVLETKEQYVRAGLTPVDACTVPTIPEPATVALLLVAGSLLAFALLRRRRAFAGGAA